MKKQKFFESKLLNSADEGLGAREIGKDGQPVKKYLNDILVMRMLYLDYFFMFMGLNAMKT